AAASRLRPPAAARGLGPSPASPLPGPSETSPAVCRPARPHAQEAPRSAHDPPVSAAAGGIAPGARPDGMDTRRLTVRPASEPGAWRLELGAALCGAPAGPVT